MSAESRRIADEGIIDRILDAETSFAARMGATPQTRWLTLPRSGIRIRALVQNGVGTPLVLLHGATLSAAWWLPLFVHLTGRTLIAPDFPGHGLSDGVPHAVRQDASSLRGLAGEVVDAALKTAGSSDGVLIGNSLGGMTALWAALDSPSSVRALILAGAPGVAFPGGRADPVLGSLAVPSIGRLLLAGRTLPRWYGRTLANSLREPTLMDLPELAMATYWASRRGTFRNSVPEVLALLLSYRTPRPEVALTDEDLRRVDAPTLYVHGNRESFLPIHMAERAVEVLPRGRLSVVEGGHTPWLASTQDFAARVRQFAQGPTSELNSPDR